METEYIIKHAELLRKNAAECTVLLKKDGQFPLEKPCKIAVFGNGARRTVKGGEGSGDVNCIRYATCESALEESGFTVTTKAWLDSYDELREKHHAEWVESIKKRAETNGTSLFVESFGAIEEECDYNFSLEGDGEACIYVLSRKSGEGHDRKFEKGDVLLTDTEIRDILALNERFEKFMLVLNVGGVVDLSPVLGVKNILLLSQLGVVTGEVFADILLGKSVPSGKLAATWARSCDYQTIGEFGDNDDTRYKEGVYVGYRYFDTVGKEPLFPFGYGLSFTDFSCGVSKIANEKSKITVCVNVKNTGKYAGKETVEIYVSSPSGKIDKPYQALAAFKKTKLLAAGEAETLEISFDLKELASYDEAAAHFVLEKGAYAVRVGSSCRNTTVAGVVELTESVVTEKVKNALGKPDFVDAVLACGSREKLPKPFAELSSKDFATVEHDYVIDEHIDEKIKLLPDDKLINMVIGAYLPAEKLSVLGASACHVCGASGETNNYVHDVTDGKYLVLADGPAGLRITAEYIVNEQGMRPVNRRLTGILEFLTKEQQDYILSVGKNAKEEDIIRQNTTAIPIGMAIAQSWNDEIACLCGNIVGTECEIFKCHFWLAPAMNIYRSILCGRNFEYYSEDPLITGKIAAGIVRGVQKHKNIGCTIKHFCANNQETNRYNNNSIVSERAMREIYLKGFEICVKESAPKAVMTSYNLLNGEHTSQRKDLLDGILRGEWGYKGFVMTDWITTGAMFDPKSKHPGVYTHKIINAGNDLMTPGNEVDFQDLSKALEEGRITRTQLMICATRVYEAIMENNK